MPDMIGSFWIAGRTSILLPHPFLMHKHTFFIHQTSNQVTPVSAGRTDIPGDCCASIGEVLLSFQKKPPVKNMTSEPKEVQQISDGWEMQDPLLVYYSS